MNSSKNFPDNGIHIQDSKHAIKLVIYTIGTSLYWKK